MILKHCELHFQFLNKEFLFYSRPKGTYEGLDTEKLLLDFYLVNTELSPDGNKVRLTITQNGLIVHYTTLDRWVPYYIEGLEKGEVKIIGKLNLDSSVKDQFEISDKETILKIESGTVEMNNNQVTLLVD